MLPLHHQVYQKSFERVEDIDVEWLKRGNDSIDYGYTGDFSVSRFLHSIAEDYRAGLLYRAVQEHRKSLRAQQTVYSVDYHFSHEGWINGYANHTPVMHENPLEAIRISGPVSDVGLRCEVMLKDGKVCEASVREDQLLAGETGKQALIYAVRFWSDKGVSVQYSAYIQGIGWTEIHDSKEWCGDKTGRIPMCGLQLMITEGEV